MNWRKAMGKETSALWKNKIWATIELPKGNKPMGCKWVYTVKYKGNGTLERYKARLIVKGYTRAYKVDH